MKIQFYLDPDTGLPHIYKHGINEYEVEEVLQNPGEDRQGSKGTRIIIGQTFAGRYLRIICKIESNSIFVITAYELKGKPLTAYKRRRHRRM
ncbi:MAG: DUF4258 domain-containing protein [Candidatus Poribacteria bacterium]